MLGGYFCINMSGPIEPGDDLLFRDFLLRSKAPARCSVYIDSSGGDVEAAIGIGRTIRDNWFSTSIGQCVINFDRSTADSGFRRLMPGKCMSAATLVFLGGRLRYFTDGSVFGVHRFSLRNPDPGHIGRSQELSAMIARYLADMGIRMEFMSTSASTSSDSIQTLTKDRLTELGVITGGVTEAVWSIHATDKIMYVKGERDSIFGHHKVILGYSRSHGFIFWAVIESQGRERKLSVHALVEIVLNGEDRRIDISARCSRQVMGNYTNFIAPLTDEEARAVAYSESFGIQVRFSRESQLFLGASAVSTEGGAQSLQTFYECLRGGRLEA